MSLYHKYRPKNLDEMVGNETTVTALKAMLENKETCTHAFFIHGPSGSGKTTLARIIANELESKGSDFIEINSADFRGIDTIRELRTQAQYYPMESKRRVFLLDEFHKNTNDAQNALLKLLEDTPSHAYFVLCTTEPSKVINTIKNRCAQYKVDLLNDDEMFSLLRSVTKAEEKNMPKPVYMQIIQDSLGVPRQALQILDQVLKVDSEEWLEIAKKSAETFSESIELCRALISKTSWKETSRILSGLTKEDPEKIRWHVLGYCQSVLLKDDNEVAGIIIDEFKYPFYDSGFPGLVLACYLVYKQK